jgi:molecular chaperone GrpE
MIAMSKETPKIATPSDEEVAQYSDRQDPAGPRDDSLSQLQRERDEYKDKMQRAQAECANIAKRLHQQHAESLKLSGMSLARDILPVLDNFERTLANLKDAHAEDPVIAGVKLVADQLTKVLKDHGVEPIEAIGKQFDPSIHEALLHDRQSEELPGTVTQEFERGYRMHDRVLRHSKVAVAAEPPGDPTETP